MKNKNFLGALWQHPGHLIWILLAYLPFLGKMSVPLTGDQKVYLSIAMEMREKGSWIKPLLFGEGSYYKPPFQYWATLLGWKALGFNLWGALVPSALAVLLTAWLIGEIAGLLHEKKYFISAGLWFAGTLGTAVYGSTAQMEIYLCLFYAASWWAGLKFLVPAREDRTYGWLYVAFAIAGFSALVKSPLYSVFWVVSYLSYLILSGEWEMFTDKHLYRSWALGVVCASLWYIAMFAIDGSKFWSDYFLRETWEKKAGNSGSALSLWGALLYFCFPFTLLIFPTLKETWKKRRSGQILRFVLCWSWLPALFFSLYPYKIKPYLYLLLPALAVFVDWGCYRISRSKIFKWFSALTGGVAFVVLGGVGWILFKAEIMPAWIAALFALTAVLFLVAGMMQWTRAMALAGLSAVLVFRIAAVSLGEWDILGLRTVHQAQPDASIAMLDEDKNIWHEVGLLSTALGTPMLRIETLEDVADTLQSSGMVILTEDQYKKYYRNIQAKLMGRGDLRDIHEFKWRRWKVRTHFPFKDIIKKGRSGVQGFEDLTERRFQILSLRRI